MQQTRRQIGVARFLLEALCIVAGAEFCVMLILPILAPGLRDWQEAALDAALLTTMSAPVLVWRLWQVGFRDQSPQLLGKQPIRTSVVWALATFVLGGMLSLLGAFQLHVNQRQSAQARFDRATEQIEREIEGRFDRALQGFKGIHSAITMLGREMTHSEFRNLIADRYGKDGLPGIRGLGYIRRVPRSELAAYLAAQQAQVGPEFRVKTGGQAPDLYVITHIEPLEHNRPAWGYDVGSEAVRRQAIESAVRTGQVTLTSRIVLVQDGQRRAGFLLYMPVYQNGASYATEAERQARLLGVIYAPIVVDEVLQGVGPAQADPVDFGLFDSPTLSMQSLLAGRWREAQPHDDAAHLVRRHVLHVGGQELVLAMDATEAFEREYDRAAPVWVGLLGVVLSGVLGMTVWLLRSGRIRAEVMARGITQEMEAAKQSAEHALRESQALLDTLDQFSMVCVTAPDGSIIEVNDVLCRASGYTRAELLGRNPRLLGSGIHEPFFWIEVWQSLLHGRAWSGQVCNRAKDGSLYWVQCVMAPIRRADGEVDKYIAIAYDVTEARRVQDELAASAERYNLAIDGGSDGLWDWMNVHSHEEWWSPQFFRLLGYEPDEILADLVTFDQMLHPVHQQATFAAMEAAFRDHVPFDVEYQLRTKSGEYRWFRSRAKVFFDEYGEATRMAGSIQDIHEHKLAQAQIQAHSEQMSAIFSLSPDGYVSFDAGGRVTYVSPAFANLIGMPEVAFIGLDEATFGQRLFERVVPGQAVASIDDVRHHASRVVLEMQPPARRMLEMRLSRDQGAAVSQVLAVRDVTHETEVDQMKSAFLSMAAHELRTPMASIYGFTELLLTRELKPEKQKDLLERIYRQSEAMVDIINELLDLARIEARQGKDFHFQPYSLTDLVGEVIRDFKTPEGRHAPVVTWPAEPMTVWVDAKKMQQAVLNVLSNAYKYSPQGGDVEIHFLTQEGAERGQLGVLIRDHGIGLSPVQLARVGERFYRADKSGSIPGTGLGVAIVKEILERMGGRLTLSSELGQGCSVTLWVPQMDWSHTQAQVTVTDASL